MALIIRREARRPSAQPGRRGRTDLRKDGPQGPGGQQVAKRDAGPLAHEDHRGPLAALRDREHGAVHAEQPPDQLPRRRRYLLAGPSIRQLRDAQESRPGRESARIAGQSLPVNPIAPSPFLEFPRGAKIVKISLGLLPSV